MNQSKLNRELQRQMLEQARDVYPLWQSKLKVPDSSHQERGFNIAYLVDHGLIEIPGSINISNLHQFETVPIRITAQGIDFLEDDGGVSAILSTVTVRLHADTMRELISLRIAASALPQAEKSTALDHIKRLPAKVLEKGIDKLLTWAIAQVPDVSQLLSMFDPSSLPGIVQT